MYSKDKVKENLTPDHIYSILEYLGGEPKDELDYILSKTICHDGDSRKLYYYKDSGLFKCYTHCEDTFDIFSLIQKVQRCSFTAAIEFVVNFANLQGDLSETYSEQQTYEYKLNAKLENIKRLTQQAIKQHEQVVLPEIDKNILKDFPQPKILSWEKEGIQKSVCDYMNIKYNPCNGSIIIPHYDENDRLIGVRERTLVKENEVYGKYKPATIHGLMYNHPLGTQLYGLNKAKDNIVNAKQAVIFESEKSVLQAISYLGVSSNIFVAVCGSNISIQQINLLRKYGVKEICVGFDKDWKEIRGDEYKHIIEKLTGIYNKYNSLVNISFLFDRTGTKLQYKMSPTDNGKSAFLELWRDRVFLA